MAFQPFKLKKQTPKDARNYCLNVLPNSTESILAIPNSSNKIQILNSTNLNLISELNNEIDLNNVDINFQNSLKKKKRQLKEVLTDCTFGGTENLFYTCLNDVEGTVNIWDLRSGGKVSVFKGYVPLLSIAVSCAGDLLAAGTELQEEDAKVLFWDLRNTSTKLSEFSEAHSDDITQVKFHPNFKNWLTTGSTDGTLSIYNIEKTFDEDEAIFQTIRDNSINKLGFFGPSNEYIFSLTHIETLSIFRVEDAETIVSFGDVRNTTKLNDSSTAIDYLIDCQYISSLMRLFVFYGTNDGNLGILNVDLDSLDLVHKLKGGHNGLVRGAHWRRDGRSLVSCSEDGVVSLWDNF
ncbi:WD repeat-containing protein 89 [Clydaea vesicula]|uniref:WD repeat-containing protein 89 n=1 Tax=Clydaea vesicula TaxID=447962 RepID=A0AAD5TZ18_9FUNG|nr:WD repeat-containing protein 89 [Clydaea vesicula]